jgi:hypothetical protein
MMTGFKGAISWAKRLWMLQNWRAIALEYNDLNLTLYEDFSIYADQVKIRLTSIQIGKSMFETFPRCFFYNVCDFASINGFFIETGIDAWFNNNLFINTRTVDCNFCILYYFQLC